MSTAETYIDIYTNLGFLFYSVAAGDGQVRAAEVATLKHLVKERWIPLESSRDEFGIDAAEYISMSFDYAHNNALDAGAAFDRFEGAYREHVKRFDPDLKKLVMNTAAAIADAFGHANKAELTSLMRIQQLFREQA
ncbi:MAG: TerB family tellurite resistance protein [Flavobacteriales bacterium]|nr:TerB family tellurite resistance protein [Flavobacteriales bacterium]